MSNPKSMEMGFKPSPRDIFTIQVQNWLEHNAKSKPSQPTIAISKRFFDDFRIRSLPASGKLLYLGLLLLRGDTTTVYSGTAQSIDATFVVASRDLLQTYAGGTGNLLETLLDQLQSFQLVTYEKKMSANLRKKGDQKNRGISEADDCDKIEPVRLDAEGSSAALEPKEAQQKLLVEKSRQAEKRALEEQLEQISTVQELVSLIPDKTRQNWKALYSGDEEFVKRELLRIWQYYAIDNAHKKPRKIVGWSRAINTWLERSWIKRPSQLGARSVPQRQ